MVPGLGLKEFLGWWENAQHHTFVYRTEGWESAEKSYRADERGQDSEERRGERKGLALPGWTMGRNRAAQMLGWEACDDDRRGHPSPGRGESLRMVRMWFGMHGVRRGGLTGAMEGRGAGTRLAGPPGGGAGRGQRAGPQRWGTRGPPAAPRPPHSHGLPAPPPSDRLPLNHPSSPHVLVTFHVEDGQKKAIPPSVLLDSHADFNPLYLLMNLLLQVLLPPLHLQTLLSLLLLLAALTHSVLTAFIFL